MSATVGALMLLAAGLPQLVFRPGRVFVLSGSPSTPGEVGAEQLSVGDVTFWQMLFALTFLGLLVVFVLALILSRNMRRDLLRRLGTALLFGLLLYMLLSALGGGMARLQAQLGPPAARPVEPLAGEPLPAFVAEPSGGLVLAVSLLLAALLLAGMWFFWRRGRQPTSERRLANVAQAALTDIQAGGDVQDTVLRCYLEMSRVLGERRGMERQQAMTPREFEGYLAASGLRDGHIKRLTRLFEGARYSARRPGAREEREAVDCLTAIVEAYGSAS